MSQSLLPLEAGIIGRIIFHNGSKASIKAYPLLSCRLETPESPEAQAYRLYTLNQFKERTLQGPVLIQIVGNVIVDWSGCELPSIMFNTRNCNNLIFSPNRVHTIAGLKPPVRDSSELFR